MIRRSLARVAVEAQRSSLAAQIFWPRREDHAAADSTAMLFGLQGPSEKSSYIRYDIPGEMLMLNCGD